MSGTIDRNVLGDERRLLAAVVDAADDAIFTKDLNGTVMSWNRAAEQIYGYTEDEMVGAPVAQIVPPEKRAEFADILRRVARGERVERLQTVRVARDGRRIDIALTVAPLTDSDGRIIGASSIARDITERIRLGEELRAAQRLEALGRFAGGIAHEFNDILVSIGGHAALLLDDLDESDPRRASAAAIRRAADRAAAITVQLEAVSQQRPVNLRILDIDRVLEHAVPLIERTIGEAIRLDVLDGRPVGYIRADAGLLEQAIVNLARALGARMPDGGRLSIATTDVRNGALGPDETPLVRIVFADTGPEIEADALRHLFEPFAGNGGHDAISGLDFATARGIIAQLGGRITPASDHHGLSLTVDLPAEPEEEPPSVEVVDTRPRGGDESIIVVDDDADARELIARVLQRYGYGVQTASSGEEALERASDYFASPVDLVIADVVLPGVTGPELVDRLRVDRPHIAALYVSGYTQNTVAYHGRDGLAEAFLAKPFSPEQLAVRVREILDERSAKHA